MRSNSEERQELKRDFDKMAKSEFDRIKELEQFRDFYLLEMEGSLADSFIKTAHILNTLIPLLKDFEKRINELEKRPTYKKGEVHYRGK